MDSSDLLAASGRSRVAVRSWTRSFGVLNPLKAVWWLFTNVRFAIVLLLVLCAVSLAGLLLPQKPLPVRGDVVADAAWLDLQQERFGFLAAPLDAASLFDVFHARWFGVLLVITAASTAAYVASRVPGVWRAITRPRKRVPDRYFEMAPHRLDAQAALNPAGLIAVLRRSRYRVEPFEEGASTYLFADRFAWAQLGTLITHAGVIILIFSAVVSRADAFSSPLFVAEGATLPVFPVRNANQMQVELRDAHAEFAADGRPLDYRADITIYRRGEEAKRCASTVNSPCSYDGYKFYQSAYFGFGAAIEVSDLASGNVVYRETLALSESRPSPHVIIRDGTGAVVLDQTLVLTDELAAEDFTYRGTLVRLPDGRLLSIGLQRTDDGEERLAVLEPGREEDVVQLSLADGESAESGGLFVTYDGAVETPYALASDLPVPAAGGSAAGREAALQLSNVVFGSERTSEGTSLEAPAPAGPPALTLTGLQAQAVRLEEGESVEAGGYMYTFLGQREFVGITVRRDRSDYLVWAGAALLVLGLAATFWVPRRRLWARITPTRTWLAGQAPAHARYNRELARLARDAGAEGGKSRE